MDYANSYWFDDGYGDHLRHYLWAMAAIPEFAPVGENHLLGSSSVVTRVSYEPHAITYRTFDQDSREVLRLKARPRRVTAGERDLTAVNAGGGDGFTVE